MAVPSGRMRNTLYPYSMAKYVNSTIDSAITTNFRRDKYMISKHQIDRLLSSRKTQLESKTNEFPILSLIKQHEELVLLNDRWNHLEKRNALQFLHTQREKYLKLENVLDDVELNNVRKDMSKLILDKFFIGRKGITGIETILEKMALAAKMNNPDEEKVCQEERLEMANKMAAEKAEKAGNAENAEKAENGIDFISLFRERILKKEQANS